MSDPVFSGHQWYSQNALRDYPLLGGGLPADVAGILVDASLTLMAPHGTVPALGFLCWSPEVVAIEFVDQVSGDALGTASGPTPRSGQFSILQVESEDFLIAGIVVVGRPPEEPGGFFDRVVPFVPRTWINAGPSPVRILVGTSPLSGQVVIPAQGLLGLEAISPTIRFSVTAPEQVLQDCEPVFLNPRCQTATVQPILSVNGITPGSEGEISLIFDPAISPSQWVLGEDYKVAPGPAENVGEFLVSRPRIEFCLNLAPGPQHTDPPQEPEPPTP